MIDFWKIDILTKWHIPYVTMVGRRQFNIPHNGHFPATSARPFIVLESHDALIFFCHLAKHGTAVVSGFCAHVCTLSLSDFCISFRKK